MNRLLAYIRSFNRKGFTIAALILYFTVFFNLETSAQTQQAKAILFSQLNGSGSWSDPFVIGTVTQPIAIVNCPPLTSGRYLKKVFSKVFFKVTFENPLSSNSAIGTMVQITAESRSAVHPYLASEHGTILLTSGSNGYWIGDPERDETFTRCIPLKSITAGTYMIGAEKLDSPLRSTGTPEFSLLIIP